jgi:molybdopterin molybdotransferase
MTGAEVPAGCDGIIPVELLDISSDTAAAKAGAGFENSQHVHIKASDRKAGENLLQPGVLLDSPRIAILAAVGHTPVRVFSLPRVAVISTGNEIVPVSQQDIQPASSRASNAYGLVAGLQACGINHVTSIHLPDDLARTTGKIASALAQHDVLLLTGGVSKGLFDFVPAALKENGVHKVFHGVAQKPGKPFWFGKTDTATVFGLPGNPVSTLTVFRRYAVPFLQIWSGRTIPPVRMVTLTGQPASHPILTTFPPVRLREHDRAERVTYHGSGDFAALADSDGFVEVPAAYPYSADHAGLPFWPW